MPHENNSTDLETLHTGALVHQIETAGGSSVEVGYRNEKPPALWWASAVVDGGKIFAQHHAGPDFALLDLTRQFVHDGVCAGCNRRISFPHLQVGFCGRLLTQPAPGIMIYRRLCELLAIGRALGLTGQTEEE